MAGPVAPDTGPTPVDAPVEFSMMGQGQKMAPGSGVPGQTGTISCRFVLDGI